MNFIVKVMSGFLAIITASGAIIIAMYRDIISAQTAVMQLHNSNEAYIAAMIWQRADIIIALFVGMAIFWSYIFLSYIKKGNVNEG